jgi:serine/threonine protein kinase
VLALFRLLNSIAFPPVLHDLHLIHTDLKPENILLVHNDYRAVTVTVPGKVIFLMTLSSRYSLTSRRSVMLHRDLNGF